MADLVNLQERLNAKRAEDAKYLERMDLTSEMIPVMVETVEKMRAMGAERGSRHPVLTGDHRRIGDIRVAITLNASILREWLR
jgi:hypothetical protein